MLLKRISLVWSHLNDLVFQCLSCGRLLSCGGGRILFAQISDPLAVLTAVHRYVDPTASLLIFVALNFLFPGVHRVSLCGSCKL